MPKVGDIVFITKSVGNGIAVASRQVGFLQDSAWDVAQRTMLTANVIGAELGQETGVTSLTDVTGFGLVGHAVEVGEASGKCVELDLGKVPLLPGVKRAAAAGHVPLLANSNWDSFSGNVAITDELTPGETSILADPQTNGGLLITVEIQIHRSIVEEMCGQRGDHH